jgi:hypothetical protein
VRSRRSAECDLREGRNAFSTDSEKRGSAQVRAGLLNLSFEAESEGLRALQLKVFASSKYCDTPMKIQLNTGALVVIDSTQGAGTPATMR